MSVTPGYAPQLTNQLLAFLRRQSNLGTLWIGREWLALAVRHDELIKLKQPADESESESKSDASAKCVACDRTCPAECETCAIHVACRLYDGHCDVLHSVQRFLF